MQTLNKETIYCIVICILFILPTVAKIESGLENKQKAEWQQIVRQYSSYDCMLVYNKDDWSVTYYTMDHYDEIKEYKGFYCMFKENTEPLDDSRIAQAKGLVVYIYHKNDSNKTLQEIKDYTGLQTERYLYTGEAMEVYFIS